jgi:hypothetical protein
MSPEPAKEAAFTPRHRLRIMIQERGRMTAGCSERHIHAADLPAAAVAHDETCGLFLDRPGRREAACINSVATYDLNWSRSAR